MLQSQVTVQPSCIPPTICGRLVILMRRAMAMPTEAPMTRHTAYFVGKREAASENRL